MSDSGSRVRGLLDTSVVVALEHVEPSLLPDEPAVSALTLAELVAGPHASEDSDERARRQERVQLVEATFEPLPFDDGAARAYGRVYAAQVAAGRRARGRRAVDLLIAAVAVANELPLYTCNPDDFSALTKLLEIHTIDPNPADEPTNEPADHAQLLEDERSPTLGK
ncbi:MAG: type II toxin-antitoxin system VapC family toxin [Solirubrobacteraceae bacterium]